MGRTRPVGTALALLLIAGVFGSSNAFGGLPEFKLCKKFPGISSHDYTASTCAAASFSSGGGKWERVAVPIGSALSGKGFAVPRKNILGPVRPPGHRARIEGLTECQKESATGAITGATTEELEIKYTKCTAFGRKCNSPGLAAGRIATEPLEVVLIFLDAAHTTPGVRFRPKSGTLIAEYACGPFTIKEEGEAIAEQNGDIESANKHFGTRFEEGPLAAQQWPYEAQQGTEENELEYAEWRAPVAEGGDGASPPLGWTGSPFVPAYVNSLVTGALTFEGPSTQIAQSEYRGANVLVEI